MLLGYLFTFINYALYCASRFCKKKTSMLILDLIAKIAFMTALYFLGSLSGAYSMFVNFIYLIFATIKEKKGYRWPVPFAIFQSLLIWIVFSNFEGFSTILIFASISLNLIAVWWFKPQMMRASGLIVNALTLFYQLSIRNWAGLCELFVIASNAISYTKYRKEEKAATHESA